MFLNIKNNNKQKSGTSKSFFAIEYLMTSLITSKARNYHILPYRRACLEYQ